MEFASSSLSSSSSSFLTSEPLFIHDVFINFGGEEIGRRFVSHLHSVLLQSQVKTLISQENLHGGMKLEEHMRAIGHTKITIIVFSKSYTESACCLLELEKIIKCHETFGQIVLPVFYEIDPSDVLHQKDDFGKALEEIAHKCYSGEQLEDALCSWSHALTTTAGMTGWDDRDFRHDAELVERIVSRVKTLLDYKDLFITQYPVGLESRVEDVIKGIEKQSIKVCMNKNESLELLSWHAFREAIPIKELNELARDIVAYTEGLPLALEFLGSYLCDRRTKEEWESVLRKLQRIPPSELLNVLKISFDDLCATEKDIFLDICCFFIGKERDYVTEILNGCGLNADIGITVLIERSLIKVDRNNKLQMHPLLRDMGREIIHQECSKEQGKMSRLWFQNDVKDVLKENTVLERLKFLNLSHSKYLKETPDFSGLPSLKKLILKDCPNLCKVHQSIGRLRNLLVINLKDCTSLSYLPKEVYELRSLKILILSSCLKFPPIDTGLVKSSVTIIAENTKTSAL